MRYLTLGEILLLHRQLLRQTVGAPGLRDLGLLESALAQPRQTFEGVDLYPTVVSKAAALGFSLVANHPFVDGNKRLGHAAMEVTLVLNGAELIAGIDDQEHTMLALAAGTLTREAFTAWVVRHVTHRSIDP